MTTNDLTLFGGHTTQNGQRVSSGLARQTKREMEQVAAGAEILAVREQANAFLTSVAMTNVTTLVLQAEAHMKVAPSGGQFYEALITNYTIGAGQRLGRGV